MIISAPTQSQRREILECHLADLPVTSDLDLDTLSAVTNGYVGADLASLCHEAAYMAMAEGSDNSQISRVTFILVVTCFFCCNRVFFSVFHHYIFSVYPYFNLR